MDTLVKADIFFFITTLAVAFVSAAFIIALIYLIRISRDILSISHKAKDEGEKIIQDIDSARETLKKEGKEATKDFISFRGKFKKEAEKFLSFLAFLASFFSSKGGSASGGKIKKGHQKNKKIFLKIN